MSSTCLCRGEDHRFWELQLGPFLRPVNLIVQEHTPPVDHVDKKEQR